MGAQGSTKPSRIANRVSSTLSCISSFDIMLDAWFSTVFTERCISAAIYFFESPFAT